MISSQGDNLVFLLGLPRSGTTLLSVLLNGHPAVRCPPEPWLMLALESLGRTSARSASDAPVLYRAFQEFCDPATCVAAARKFAGHAYNQALAGSKKKILVDKTPRYHLILPYLAEVFPRAKYLVLWRNPLDIAASIQTTWDVNLPEQLAARQDHLFCIDLVVGLRRLIDFYKAQVPRVLALQYENLVRQPQKTMNGIWRWLDLPRGGRTETFELVGSEYDKSDCGDKKILSTAGPHQKSIGRWSQTFETNEVQTLINAIGSHVFTALGYEETLEAAAKAGASVPNPAQSNAYAQRLEVSLTARRNEYESVNSFSDLTIHERRLHQAIHATSLPPDQPVTLDVASEFRVAAAAVERMSARLAEAMSRAAALEQQRAVDQARLEESRAQAREQGAQAAGRQAELAALAQARERDVQAGQTRQDELARQLHDAQSHLQSIQVELSAEKSRAADLNRRLQETEVQLVAAGEELYADRTRLSELDAQFQESQAIAQRLGEELTIDRSAIDDLSAQLKEARALAAAGAAPVQNRRTWPYAAPDQTPLPATLPGGKPWPRISVITPSFNQGNYIEQTMLSVLNQNYPNLEYIVIDGASADHSVSVINRYRHRLAYFVSEKDKGQSQALNKGFARATGELLTWINSDDMLEPGALAAMAMAFHTSGADLVAGVCTLHNDGKIVGRHLTACVDGPLPMEDLLDLDECWLKGQFFYQPEVMFSRTLWEKAGGYVDENLFYSMDYDLWLRFAEQGARLHTIGRPIGLFRVHEQQKTHKMQDYHPELITVRDRFLQRGAKMRSRNGQSAVPRTQLRVVFFNDLGSVGGAAIAHQRLAASVASAGHEVVPIAIAPTLLKSALPLESILAAIAERNPDLVFLGNIHSAQLDHTIIGAIAQRWPTVQVLHDLYSLTGRCAYTGDCKKYLTGCDHSCPTAHEYPVLDPAMIGGAWKHKHETMTGDKAPIVAAVSQWTESFARDRFQQSDPQSLPQAQSPRIISIRYGLPVEIFKPRDKSMCRDMLGLPQDRFIVLFSSSHLGDKRKGLEHLTAALESLKLPDLLAVCIGHFEAPTTAGFDIRSMGYINDAYSLAMLYSAADIFVGPSLVETFGQVFIEAAACGTPSVGYATAGGVAEAVAPGISGQLAAAQDPLELATLIAAMHADPLLRRDMAAWGRLWVENEFSFRSAYQRIFSQLSRIGLIRTLNLAPNISYLHDSIRPAAVAYLESQPASVPAVAVPGNGSYTQMESRLASIEAERDSLRTAVHNITQTRLWRMVGVAYPMYQRTLGNKSIPHFARRRIEALGQWFARKPGKP